MVSFTIFTASVRKILDQPMYELYVISVITGMMN